MKSEIKENGWKAEYKSFLLIFTVRGYIFKTTLKKDSATSENTTLLLPLISSDFFPDMHSCISYGLP